MRVAYLAAGAGGMYCGSCMHDNRLAATLIADGRDVVLVPLYTPLRTDEANVSQRRVFCGGINTYLQQSSAFFRHTPWFLDRLFNMPSLLRIVGRFASSTRPEDLGPLTLSMLKGEDGAQRKELEKLVVGLRRLRPDLIYLPNLMLVGFARRLKATIGAPVLCGLVGEDIFLDRLPEPHRAEVFQLIRRRAADVDAFVALTGYYAEHAVRHFGVPADRVHHIPMGIRAADFARTSTPSAEPLTIGYLARVCPEKGLRELCEVFTRLRQAGRDCRLRAAGYLGGADRPYLARVRADLRQRGVDDAFEYVGEVSREEKIRFLRSLHVLCVPTVYPESKGLYVLEALAANVPVVLPDHGAFPELVDATGGGLLYEAGDAEALAQTLATLLDNAGLRQRLADCGRAAVNAAFTAERSAAEAWRLFQRLRINSA